MLSQPSKARALPMMEDVSRLAKQHGKPLLSLQAYACALSFADNWKTHGVNVSEVDLLHLADFILRCNGFALKEMRVKPANADAVRDYFHVALSELLPITFQEHTLSSSQGYEEACKSIDESNEANYSAGEANPDGGTDEMDSQPDSSVCLYDFRSLEHRLLALHRSLDAAVREESTSSATVFILLSLTLSNWACTEMRYRNTEKAYTLLRCSGVARDCALQVATRQMKRSTSSVTRTSSSSLELPESVTITEKDEAEEQVSKVCQSWFGSDLVAAVLEVNDCAQQSMFCNWPEAAEDARLALLAIERGNGNTEMRFLRAIALVASAVAEEYSNAEVALTRYNAATLTLQDSQDITARPFEAAAVRDQAESLISRMAARLEQFVTEARTKAMALATAADSAANGTSRVRKPRGAPGASTKTRDRAAANTSKKGDKRGKRVSHHTAAANADRALVLEVPPIDSQLRTSIRRFGFPVLVFNTLPVAEALQLLFPELEELREGRWISPLEDISVDATDACGEPLACGHVAAPGDNVGQSAQTFNVLAVMVCTETPLQWALEAAALAANPIVPRYSVWTLPPPLLEDESPAQQHEPSMRLPCVSSSQDTFDYPNAAKPLGAEEPITRSRLARCLLLARKYDSDDGVPTRSGDLPVLKPGASNGDGKKPRNQSEAPAGFVAASIGPPPHASALDSAKKGVTNAVKLLSSRLNVLLKAEKAFENRWAATDKVRSALMCYYVPQQLAKLKVMLLEKKRSQETKEDYCARVLVRFFRRVVQEKPRLQGFLTRDERRLREEEAAAVTLQRYARRWMAVQVRKELTLKRNEFIAKVTLVQSLCRRRKAAHYTSSLSAARRTAEAAKGAEARNHFAAMQIQRVYRGHATRLQVWAATGQHERALFHHLHDSRHYFATLIQKRARGMLMRRQHGDAVNARRWYARNTCRAKALTESSITIQRYYRGYRVRRQLFDAARGVQEKREEKERTGFLFKRYLEPSARNAFADSPSQQKGFIVTPAAAVSAVASTSLVYDGRAAGDQFEQRSGNSLSRADQAAVKIQSLCRRWIATRRVANMLSSRQSLVAARRNEIYKPFVADEYIF